MSDHSTAHPRVRVAVVLAKDDQLLLVRHRKGEKTYWLLPGGGLDFGESVEQCAMRELFEETGLEIAVSRFLYLSEAIAPDKSRHILNVYVLGEITGGTITRPEEDVIEEIAFMPFEQLAELTLYPAIAEALLASWREDFNHEVRYLGQRWV